MDFVKKHYEKIILSVVLLGLVGALLVLPFIISGDQQRMRDVTDTIIRSTATPLPSLDLTQPDAVLDRLKSPAGFDFSSTNRLFNPQEWRRRPDGSLIQVRTSSEIAREAVVTKITPLYFIVSFNSVETNVGAPRYRISIERQGATYSSQRQRTERFVSMEDAKKDFFTLLQVKGSPDNPTSLVLKLTDSGETVTISKDKPYMRADAYMADLKYPPENKIFLNRREGSAISFGGEDYIIVAIHPNEVILSAASNQKRTTLPYTP